MFLLQHFHVVPSLFDALNFHLEFFGTQFADFVSLLCNAEKNYMLCNDAHAVSTRCYLVAMQTNARKQSNRDGNSHKTEKVKQEALKADICTHTRAATNSKENCRKFIHTDTHTDVAASSEYGGCLMVFVCESANVWIILSLPHGASERASEYAKIWLNY